MAAIKASGKSTRVIRLLVPGVRDSEVRETRQVGQIVAIHSIAELVVRRPVERGRQRRRTGSRLQDDVENVVTDTASVREAGEVAPEHAHPIGRRRVGDDVLDIVLQAAAGATPLTPAFNRSPNNGLGDGVNSNDVPYLSTFPYLGIPHAGNK